MDGEEGKMVAKNEDEEEEGEDSEHISDNRCIRVLLILPFLSPEPPII